MSNMPIIILVLPQMGENIGMVARSMLNCGVESLRLVAPRDGWPNPAAVSAAAGATDVIEGTTVFETTEEAVADLKYVYAATGRRRFMQKPSVPFLEVAPMILERVGATGLLFGCESSGLSNEDVVLADALLHIPVNPDFPSLNLAQAVYAVCHQILLTSQGSAFHDVMTLEPPAERAELVGFYQHLETELDAAGFLKPAHKRAKMVQNLRNLFQKATLTAQEVRTLRGVVRALSRKSRGE